MRKSVYEKIRQRGIQHSSKVAGLERLAWKPVCVHCISIDFSRIWHVFLETILQALPQVFFVN